jgi:hypothetical protein
MWHGWERRGVRTGFWLENQKQTVGRDLKEIGWEVVDWIKLALDRDKSQAVVHMVMNFKVP